MQPTSDSEFDPDGTESALSGIGRWLHRLPAPQFSAYCILAAFGTYFCMYAFRKPFTAATFEGDVLGGMGLKTLYIAAQILGYTLSKFLGIRFVSSLPPGRRAVAILALIGVAQVALVLFACTPAPWSAGWLFVNGLPLGMVFGLVMGFLEGRRQTEALAAGLCASFILASGVVKSIGRGLIENHGVPEAWMPAATGLLFTVPLLLFVGLLAQIPPPRPEDVSARAPRPALGPNDRARFFARFAPGLCGLVAVYVLLTVARSVRDDFAVEIWRDLGNSGAPGVFAATEVWVMAGVLLLNGASVRVRSNGRAFLASLGISIAGFLLLASTLAMRRAGYLDAFAFMTLTGLGLYVPYVAFHTTVFERLIATFRERANLGYLLYLADAFGYLGYVGVLVARHRIEGSAPMLGTFEALLWSVAALATLLTLATGAYFLRRIARAKAEPGGAPLTAP